MSARKIIESKGEKLAIYFPASGWSEGLNFISDDEDFVQVGMWGYDKGTKLSAHRHKEVRREITRTQEVIFIKSGRVIASIYDEGNKVIKKLELRAGDILVLLNGGHGYEVVEDNTRVLEIKNGPYPGAEADRERI